MRKVKLGLASAGALSASFLKAFGGGNSQDCNQCIPSTQHPRPLSPDPDPQATLIPSKAVLVSAESLGLTMKQLRLPVSAECLGLIVLRLPVRLYPRVYSKPSPRYLLCIPLWVFCPKQPLLLPQAMKLLIFVQASCPFISPLTFLSLDIAPEVVSEIAADHRSGFKTKQEGDNWRTRNRVHNKIHRACRRGSMRRAVEGGKDIQRVTSMTIDMTKPFHLPCLHQATRLGAADEAAECDLVLGSMLIVIVMTRHVDRKLSRPNEATRELCTMVIILLAQLNSRHIYSCRCDWIAHISRYMLVSYDNRQMASDQKGSSSIPRTPPISPSSTSTQGVGEVMGESREGKDKPLAPPTPAEVEAGYQGGEYDEQGDIYSLFAADCEKAEKKRTGQGEQSPISPISSPDEGYAVPPTPESDIPQPQSTSQLGAGSKTTPSDDCTIMMLESPETNSEGTFEGHVMWVDDSGATSSDSQSPHKDSFVKMRLEP
eukprot:g54394.t1